jgi:lipopolysaccharide export LptBFGC system permease protein LptF
VCIISRYILRETIVPSFLAFVVITFVAIANELRERIERLPLAYVSLQDLARLAMYFVPALTVYVVPVTYMMGLLLAFARLAQQNEITAMRAAGVPLKRVVLPVIAGGALLSIVVFGVQDRVQTWAIGRAHRLVTVELPLRITFDALPPGVMHEFGDWRVYIGSKDSRSGTLHDVDILIPDDEGRAQVFHTESARVVREQGRTVIQMQKGHVILPPEKGALGRITFRETNLVVPQRLPRMAPPARSQMTLGQLYKRQAEMEIILDARDNSSFDEALVAALDEGDTGEATLDRMVDDLKLDRPGLDALSPHVLRDMLATPADRLKDELRKVREEIGDRLSLPFACLAVSIAAAPLVVRGRHGGRSYSFAIGFSVALFYYLLYMVLKPRGLQDLPEVVVRTMAPNVILGLAGLWFLWRVDRV